MLRFLRDALTTPKSKSERKDFGVETPDTAAESPDLKMDATTGTTSTTATATATATSIPELFALIDSEIRVNIGVSVRCGICLSTMQSPMRTLCGHAFCKDCILASLMATKQTCPECKAPVTKRSLQPHQHLTKLAKVYKQSLIEFGFTPSKYRSDFTTLTQKPMASTLSHDTNATEEDTDTPQHFLDRFHVAQTWKEQAMPKVKPSVVQQQENQQVVEANQEACYDLGFTCRPKHGTKSKDTQATAKVTATTANTAVNTTVLPTTQEVQEDARAQQAADFEFEEQLHEEEEAEEQDVMDDETTEKPRKSRRSVSFQPTSKKTATRPPLAPSLRSSRTARQGPKQSKEQPKTSQESHKPSPAEESPTKILFQASLSPIAAQSSQGDVDVQLDCIEPTFQQDTAQKSDKPVAAPSPSGNNVVEDSFGALHWTNPMTLTPADEDRDEDEETLLGEEEDAKQEQVPTSTTDDKPEMEQKSANEPKSPDSKLASATTTTPVPKGLPEAPSSVDPDKTVPMTMPDDDDDDGEQLPSVETAHEESKVDKAPPLSSTKRRSNLRQSKEGVTAAAPGTEESHDNVENAASDDAIEQSYAVGDVVNVQSRTWSGINKPGGVARIAKVNDDGTFNVSYILGGRERNVDPIYVSSSEDAGKRRRQETTEAALPTELRQALAAQGFDTTGSISLAEAQQASKKRTPVPSSNARTSRRVLKEVSNKASTLVGKAASKASKTATKVLASSKRKRASAESSNTTKKGKGPGKKAAPITQWFGAASAKTDSKATGKKTLKRDLSVKSDSTTTTTKRRKSKPTKASLPVAPMLSTEEACRLALERYQQNFADAVEKEKTIYVVASNLNDADMKILKSLCGKGTNDNVAFKLSEAVTKKTTICVTPLVSSGTAKVTQSRTAKAMRSTLAGIPVVDPAWLEACAKQQKAVVPDKSMCATGLPTKNPDIDSSGESDWGIAHMAASLSEGGGLPLDSVYVFLAGDFAANKRKDLQLLCKEAGAILLTSAEAATAKLGRAPVVVLCQDKASGTVLPTGLVKDIRRWMKKDPSSLSLRLVNPQWVFESITCSRQLGVKPFLPVNAKAKELSLELQSISS